MSDLLAEMTGQAVTANSGNSNDLLAEMTATPVVPATKKKQLPLPFIPMPVRDIARGIVSVPSDVARLTGAIGESAISRWGESANQWIDENIAPEARFSNEPGRAILQLGGSALIPVPSSGIALKVISKAPTALKPAAAGVAKLTELALPGSAPYTLPNVALNAAVGVGAGAAVEQLVDAAYPERVPVPQPPPASTSIANPVVTEPAAMQQQDLFSEMTTEPAPQGNPYAQMAVKALPYALLGLGVLSVGAAARAQSRIAKAADAANVGGNVQPGTPVNSAPTSSVGERVEAGIFNNLEHVHTRVREAVKQGSITPERGDELISLTSINLREAINNDRTNEMMWTGVFDKNHQTIAPKLWAEEAARLTPDQRRLLNDTLPAHDELDVRTENVRQNKFDKKTGEPEAVALSHKTYAELQRDVTRGLADPAVAKLVQEYRSINNALLNYSVDKGIFSPKEASDMRAKGPHYMHRVIADLTIERNTGAGMPLTQGTESNSPLTRRTRKEGSGPDYYQDPLFALEDGIRQTLDFINRNEAIRELATSLPQSRHVGRILPAASGVANGYTGIKFRDKGSRLQWEVSKDIAGVVMPYPRTTVPVLSNARVAEQYFTTGPVGALLGNIQAFTSSATSGLTAMVTAPSKIRMGYVDALLRRVTDGKLNIRALGLVDPTFAVQVVDAMARDVAAQSAYSLGNMLNRSLASNGRISRLLGTDWSTSVRDRMLNAYHDSLLHYMRQQGVMSQGVSYSSDARPTATNIANMAPDYAYSMPYGGNAPSIMNVRSWQQFEEYLALQGSRMTPAGMRRSWHFFSKVLDLLSNSPQSAMYRANMDHFKGRETELAGIARTVVGDPAQYGGFKGVQAATSMLTYQNIAMQAAHQVFKAIQREPVSASMRTATLGTMLAYVMIHSAITSDEDAIDRGEEPKAVAHMLTRDPNDAARSFRLYYGTSNPETAIRIPIDGALAPAFSAILAGLVEAFEVDRPDFFTDRYAPLRDSIERLISDGNTDRMYNAIGIAGLDMATPSIARLYGKLALQQDWRNALSLGSGPRSTDIATAPGYAKTSLNNDVLDQYTAAVLETMFGLGGQTVADLARTYGYTYRIDPGEAAYATAQQYGLNMGSGGSSRIIAPALGIERRLRINDQVGEQVRRVEDNLQQIQKGFAEVEGGPGTIGGKRDLRTSPYGAGREGVHPDMVELLAAAKSYYNDLDDYRTMRKRESDLIKDVQSSSLLRSNPQKLRNTSNEHAMNIRSINASIYAAIDQFEKDWSARTGRRIRLDTLDPTKPLNQFAPLQ